MFGSIICRKPGLDFDKTESAYRFANAYGLLDNCVLKYSRIFCVANAFDTCFHLFYINWSFVILFVRPYFCLVFHISRVLSRNVFNTFFSGIYLDFQKPLFKRNVTSLEGLHPGTRLSGRVTNMTSFGAFVDCGVGRDGLVHNSSMGRFKGKVGLGDLVEVTVKSVDIQKQHIGLILTDISSRFDPQLLVSIGNLSQACAWWKEMNYCWGNKIVNSGCKFYLSGHVEIRN